MERSASLDGPRWLLSRIRLHPPRPGGRGARGAHLARRQVAPRLGSAGPSTRRGQHRPPDLRPQRRRGQHTLLPRDRRQAPDAALSESLADGSLRIGRAAALQHAGQRRRRSRDRARSILPHLCQRRTPPERHPRASLHRVQSRRPLERGQAAALSRGRRQWLEHRQRAQPRTRRSGPVFLQRPQPRLALSAHPRPGPRGSVTHRRLGQRRHQRLEVLDS